jgi:hypothetical protein
MGDVYCTYSLRQHYLDQVMGIISARCIKAPQLIHNQDIKRFNSLFKIELMGLKLYIFRLF